MESWLAGRLALPRPEALGWLGVRVMLERMVVRGREDEVAWKGEEEEEAVVTQGLNTGAEEEARVETGELRPEEDGDDLLVPLDCVWV